MMIVQPALFAVLSLALQEGASVPEARLHPADTVLLIEIPDVQKLLVAYRQAPLVQMVGDEKVRETVAALLDSLEVDLPSMIQQTAAQLELPPEIAADPCGAALDVLAGFESLSFSVSIDATRADGIARYGTELLKAKGEMLAVQATADKFREGGGWLTDMSQLELDPELLTDPWGRPYALDKDGKIGTLGADGAPGGTERDADLTSDFDLAAYFGDKLPAAVGMLLHVRCTSSDATTRVAGWLDAGLGHLGTAAQESTELEYAGAPARVTALDLSNLPQVARLPAWRMVSTREIAIGIGKSDPKELAQRRASPAAPSAASAFADKLVTLLPAPQGVPLIQIGLASMASLEVLGSLAEAASESSDVNVTFTPNQEPAILRMQLAGERFITDAFFARAPDSTMGKTLASTPIPEKLWSFVPAEAVGLFAMTIDGPGLYAEIMAESGGQAQIAELEKRYGFSLEKDVFGALGSGVVGYLLPIKGIPEFAVAVQLSDPAAFQRGLAGLMALLNDQAAGEFTVKNQPYRDTPLWTFNFPTQPSNPASMFLGGITPSLTVIEDYLVFTLTSMRAKREIKRALADEGAAIALGSYAPPADAVVYGYIDWATLVNGGYSTLRSMAGLAGAFGGELPFDVSTLPEPTTFTRFFKPTTLWARGVAAGEGTPPGLAVRYESSFGPETWIALAGGGGAAVAGVKTMEAAQPLEDVEMSPITPPKPAVDEQAASTRATLQFLLPRIAVYKIEVSHYPAQLSDLEQPSTSYPQGFLDGKPLPTDGWGRAFAYAVKPDGYSLWSLGPDGQDQQGGGDDIVGR